MWIKRIWADIWYATEAHPLEIGNFRTAKIIRQNLRIVSGVQHRLYVTPWTGWEDKLKQQLLSDEVSALDEEAIEITDRQEMEPVLFQIPQLCIPCQPDRTTSLPLCFICGENHELQCPETWLSNVQKHGYHKPTASAPGEQYKSQPSIFKYQDQRISSRVSILLPDTCFWNESKVGSYAPLNCIARGKTLTHLTSCPLWLAQKTG